MAIEIFDITEQQVSAQLSVKNVIRDMVEFSKSLVVDSESAYKTITSMYKQAREWKKCIDDKRKEVTDPLRKKVSSINDIAKELTDPLDAVIDMANAKSAGWLCILQKQKEAENEALKQAAGLFGNADELYIPEIDTKLRGNGAMLSTKMEKRFKVTDLEKVPAKYMKVDEEAIMRDIKLGMCEIPGIEVYEEKTTKLRLR